MHDIKAIAILYQLTIPISQVYKINHSKYETYRTIKNIWKSYNKKAVKMYISNRWQAVWLQPQWNVHISWGIYNHNDSMQPSDMLSTNATHLV